MPLLELPRLVRDETFRVMDEQEYSLDMVVLTMVRDLQMALDELLSMSSALERIPEDAPKVKRFLSALRYVDLDHPGNLSLPNVHAAVEIVKDFLPYARKYMSEAMV